ncbi:diaminopropionate ammonia-lyase [Streptomyces sparsogenes]|uniref:diaminopropionate ammonia-lyase n=1 Tax=Streptomyces sparsogenes TaxID=67365 RepID=UPI003331ABC1
MEQLGLLLIAREGQACPMNRQHRHFENARRLSSETQLSAAKALANLDDWDDAVAEVKSWPEYQPQPLWSLPHHAERVGIASLYYKDESRRFGRALGSFKALGAPYTVYSLLRDVVEREVGLRPSSQELRSGRFRDITSRVTVCVATDGNQGRALAYAAQTFGCRCVVYVHSGVSRGRKAAMERLGAVVIRIDGEYQESVDRSKKDAALGGWHFISSTSWEDFDDLIPRRVMNGYMVMVEEAVSQVPAPEGITHVVMQGGVGSIAAAVFLGFHKRLPAVTPRFVVVEPTDADCLYRSAVNGRPTPSSGTLKTMMAGLACGEVSPAAWKVLEALASDFVTIPDEWAVEGMRALADGAGDPPVVAGESAAGGMGVILHAQADPALRSALGLDEHSRVLLIGGEGATDPAIYEQIVGRTPDEVFARQDALTEARR